MTDSKHSQKILRLIGVAEELLGEESFAISNDDFDYLNTVTVKKGAVFDELLDLLGNNDFSYERPPGVEELIQQQYENFHALELRKKQIAMELRDKELELKRQLQVNITYKT